MQDKSRRKPVAVYRAFKIGKSSARATLEWFKTKAQNHLLESPSQRLDLSPNQENQDLIIFVHQWSSSNLTQREQRRIGKKYPDYDIKYLCNQRTTFFFGLTKFCHHNFFLHYEVLHIV